MAKERKVSWTIDIHQNKDQVWKTLVDDFQDIQKFHPLLEGSHGLNDEVGVGCERQCDLDAKGNFVQERITEIRDNRSFDIDIFHGGLPGITSLKATVEVDEKAKGNTQVKFHMFFQPKLAIMGGIMSMMLKKKFFDVLIGLKYYSETGNEVNKQNFPAIKEDFKHLIPGGSFGSKQAFATT